LHRRIHSNLTYCLRIGRYLQSIDTSNKSDGIKGFAIQTDQFIAFFYPGRFCRRTIQYMPCKPALARCRGPHASKGQGVGIQAIKMEQRIQTPIIQIILRVQSGMVGVQA
jgi:hypothetical protein